MYNKLKKHTKLVRIFAEIKLHTIYKQRQLNLLDENLIYFASITLII